jgi:hypothetical protein
MRRIPAFVTAAAAVAVGWFAAALSAQDKSDGKADPKAQPKSDAAPEAKSAPVEPAPKPSEKPAVGRADKNGVDAPGNGDDKDRLKRLAFGAGAGVQKVEPPQLPVMSLRGYIRSNGRPPAALLEIKDVGRYVVREGDHIPVMVNMVYSPAGPPDAKAARPETRGTRQILLLVKSVSAEGVVLETGVLAQTLVIR